MTEALSLTENSGQEEEEVLSTMSIWINICSQLAPLTAIMIFFSPIPTIQQISKVQSVGSLPLLPYSSMIVNAFVWFMYGVLRSEFKLWSCNGIGILLGTYYFHEYRRYCPKNASDLPGTINQHIYGIIIILSTTLLLATYLPRFEASNLIGRGGVLFCILLFASPLSALKTVIQTKSAKSIPLPFTIATIINCFLWTIMGLLEMNDFNVYFPNGLGLIFGIIQLLLKFIYGDGIKTSSSVGGGGGGVGDIGV